MATRLNQIIAVVTGKKSGVEKTLTGIYHAIQKSEIFAGLTRVYTPTDEGGETLPKEEKYPQQTVLGAIETAKAALTELINVVATQDVANCSAKADVVVNGQVVLKDVPVTHLLFLEKQLTDISTFVSKLPTLDAAERWKFDATNELYRTEPTVTNRNVKVLRNHVKYAATDKHPAQVDTYTEEKKVGEWSTTKFSTCISPKDKAEMLGRIKDLSEAVKLAREEANMLEVTKVNYGDSLLGFIFK